MPARQWFAHYAGVFDTVEINNTFYRLPEASTFAAWRANAPSGFLVAVKASRFLTHLKRLLDPEESVSRLFNHACELGDRLHQDSSLDQVSAGQAHGVSPFISIVERTAGGHIWREG